MLDCLVDLAYKVSCDFFARPHLYTEVESDLPDAVEGESPTSSILARLHGRYGTDERTPSRAQRSEIFYPIFGQDEISSTGNSSDFARLRDALTRVATAFAERQSDTGVDILKETVRKTHRPFQQYLAGFQGDSIVWSRENALPDLTEKLSYTILRTKGVAAVFAIAKTPQPSWPYSDDSQADKLVEEVSKQLSYHDDSGLEITRERCSSLRDVAIRGAEALATIIDFREENSGADITLLITKCYEWGSALQSINASRPVSDVPSSVTGKVNVVATPLISPYKR
jgi:hypothetical protein